MSLHEEKQKHLRSQGTYISLDDIPTWKKYAENKKFFPEIDMLPNCEIDKTKNSNLLNKISCFRGDITHLEIDAIVTTTSSTLLDVGGVCWSIDFATTRALEEALKSLRGCSIGEAKITECYRLPSKHVIKIVAPQGEQPDMLRNCYKNSLRLMLDNELKSIAFPCISTGLYGYPSLPAAHIAIYTVRKFLEANENVVDRVIFCILTTVDKEIYEKLLQSYFPLN